MAFENKMEQDSFETSLRRVDRYLKITGLFVVHENSGKSLGARLRKRWFFIFNVAWYYLDFLAQLAWFVDSVFIGRELVELTYSAPCIGQCVMASVKSFFHLTYENEVNDLINSLRRIQATKRMSLDVTIEKELKDLVTFLKWATYIQCGLNVSALVEFAVLPFITMAMTYYTSGNIVLELPFLILYPFDAFSIQAAPFVYLHLMYTSVALVFMVFGPDSLYYFAATFIHIQFRILHCDFENITKMPPGFSLKEPDSFTLNVETLIKRHRDLIRCVNLMEKIYSKSTLVNVVISSFLLCLTGFNITSINSLPKIMPFIGFLSLAFVQIYLCCHFGDNITQSSTKLADAIYDCRWYKLEAKSAKVLLMVLIRAQKPCTLTAYGFSDINVRTFTKILSTAWSYFALLQTLNRS